MQHAKGACVTIPRKLRSLACSALAAAALHLAMPPSWAVGALAAAAVGLLRVEAYRSAILRAGCYSLLVGCKPQRRSCIGINAASNLDPLASPLAHLRSVPSCLLPLRC
jgi:hypothetical protein